MISAMGTRTDHGPLSCNGAREMAGRSRAVPFTMVVWGSEYLGRVPLRPTTDMKTLFLQLRRVDS